MIKAVAVEQNTQIKSKVNRLIDKKRSGVVWSLDHHAVQGADPIQARLNKGVNSKMENKSLHSTFLNFLHNDSDLTSKKEHQLNGTKKTHLPLKGTGSENISSFKISCLGGAQVSVKAKGSSVEVVLIFNDRDQVPENLVAFRKIIENQLRVKFDKEVIIKVSFS